MANMSCSFIYIHLIAFIRFFIDTFLVEGNHPSSPFDQILLELVGSRRVEHSYARGCLSG